MINKSYFRIIEKYVFLGELRYRVQIIGTNIVFNIRADSDEEAVNKAIKLAEKIGLNNEYIETLRDKYKEVEK